MRGGGGNFCAVTTFEYRVHRHGPLALCGMIVYPMSEARAVLERFREVTTNAPDELTCLLIFRIAPATADFPADLHGKPIAAIAACWTGDPHAGQTTMRMLSGTLRPALNTVAIKPFKAHQTMLDAGQPFGRRYYWKSDYFPEVGDGLMSAMLEHAVRITSPHSAVLFMHMAGAPARRSADANAVGLRSAPFILNVQAAWENPQEDERHIAWARDFWSAAHPFSTGSAYVNFMTADEEDTRVQLAYGERLYARLRDIKTKVDPWNLFRSAQNIAPRDDGASVKRAT
jgi:hypothetical protein